ncbi:MAG: hypothetical protein IPI07_18725 [Flavobacteriales bacterium]|nr:hypothetical protein [Flavobacteriales bacterium]
MKRQVSTGTSVAAIRPDNANDRLSIAPHYNHNGVNSVFWGPRPDRWWRAQHAIPPHPFVSEWEHFVSTASMTTGSRKGLPQRRADPPGGHAAAVNNVQKTWSLGGNGTQPFFYFNGLLDDVH